MKLNFNYIKPLSFEYTQKENSIWGNKLSIESPEICKIIASSGSGKSTLISILTGLRSDYSGDILFDDKCASHLSSNEWSSLRSKKLSVVYQDLRLFRNLTVRQNLQLSQHITEQQSNNDLVEELAEKMQIKNQIDKVVSKLSFGQMQRVAIIRAIIRNYEWIILDEPFSHLDQQNANIAWSLITEFATKQKAGIIIACLDPYAFINAHKIFHL